jgi:hypothetical protein
MIGVDKSPLQSAPHARAKAPTELAPLSRLKIWVINYIFPLCSHHASSLSLSPSLSGIAKWNCCAAGARVASPIGAAYRCIQVCNIGEAEARSI